MARTAPVGDRRHSPRYAEAVRKAVDSAPPLSPAQKARLVLLLAGGSATR